MALLFYKMRGDRRSGSCDGAERTGDEAEVGTSTRRERERGREWSGSGDGTEEGRVGGKKVS